MFDSTMALDHHVASISKGAFFQLHNTGHIRRYLDQQSAKQLVHALVISRLDGCNSLLCGSTPESSERVRQNHYARAWEEWRAHNSPTQRTTLAPNHQPHPVQVLALTFKCLHGLAPRYLADLLTEYRPSRSLRSSSQLLLTQPKARTRIGERAFSFAGPKLWNELPLAVRQCTTIEHFKVALKTHLFREHFGAD